MRTFLQETVGLEGIANYEEGIHIVLIVVLRACRRKTSANTDQRLLSVIGLDRRELCIEGR
jgi:hypothetical protein